MHSYSAYGLTLRSEIALDDLLPPSDGDADVVLVELSREEWLEEQQRHADEATTSDHVLGHYYRRLLYLVEGGRSIKVYRNGPLADDVVRRCVISLPLALVLRQRGHLALHAGAVARGDVAIAFTGPSGVGKSTMSELFFQRGYEVLTDDLLAIRFGGGQPEVVPGSLQIRLRAGSGSVLLPEYDSLPLTYSGSDQRFRTITSRQAPAPLHRLYLLDWEDARETSIEPVASLDAVRELMPHTWAHNLFTEPHYAAQHLQHLAGLIRRGCVARLRRVRSLDALSSYVEVIEEDLAALRA